MTNGVAGGQAGRLRLQLAGDAAARPAGLERALTRAGFQIAEVGTSPDLPPPDAILITLADVHDARLAALLDGEGLAPPRVVLLAAADDDAPGIALALGADDALAAPIRLPELCARLEARIRDRQSPRRTPYEAEIRDALRDLLAEARTMLQPDEIVAALVRRLARAYALARCTFVMVSPAPSGHRLVADSEPDSTEPRGRFDPDDHPEIAEAVRTRRPVRIEARGAPDGAAPSIALPVLRSNDVPAVMVLERHVSQPDLSAAQIEMAASLAQMALHTLEQIVPSGGGGRAETGALGRRLQQELERARRYALGFSLVLLQAQPAPASNGNGTGPHDDPDGLRREIGARLRRELRGPDYVVRYGGDAFAIVLPETGPEGALRSVVRLRERLDALPPGPTGRPVFSAGIVSYPHPAVTQTDDLLALGEAALRLGTLQSGDRIGRAE